MSLKNKDSKTVDPNQIKVENGKEELAPKPKRAPTREVHGTLDLEDMIYIEGDK